MAAKSCWPKALQVSRPGISLSGFAEPNLPAEQTGGQHCRASRYDQTNNREWDGDVCDSNCVKNHISAWPCPHRKDIRPYSLYIPDKGRARHVRQPAHPRGPVSQVRSWGEVNWHVLGCYAFPRGLPEKRGT